MVDRETQQNYGLTNPTIIGAKVELCCGGQTVEYPAHWCVDLGFVLDAVDYFGRTGGMAPHLTWDEDC